MSDQPKLLRNIHSIVPDMNGIVSFLFFLLFVLFWRFSSVRLWHITVTVLFVFTSIAKQRGAPLRSFNHPPIMFPNKKKKKTTTTYK